MIDDATPFELPFLLLDGPSGIGKTQSVFTLLSNKEFVNAYAAVYLVLDVTSPNLQPIYRAFKTQSLLLQDCISRDLAAFPITMVPHCHDILENRPFETVMFFDFLFFQTSTCKTILNLRTKIQAEQKNYVVFLDETPPISEHRRYVAFIRNILRLCGIVPVLLGTDSTAANLVPKAKDGSRGRGNLWCTVVVKFPTCLPSTGLAWLKPSDRHLLCRGNPWICRLVQEELMV